MPDRIFFPLMLMIVIGMVWAATWRDETACPTGSVSAANTDYYTIEVSGPQLNRFISGETVEQTPCNAHEPYVLGLRTLTSELPDAADKGPHFRIAPDIEVTFSGRRIRVVVRARSGTNTGAAGFEMNYLTGPEGESGWQRYDLTSTFQDYSFRYDVPKAGQDLGVDFLGIRPIITKQGDTIEIESVTFLL